MKNIDKVTKYDLADSLLRTIELGASGATITCKRNVVSLTTTTRSVSFIGGEIESYNIDTDTLEVFLNTIRLTEGEHYTLNPASQTIECLDTAGWGYNLSVEAQPNVFEFFMISSVDLEDYKFGVDNLSEEIIQLIQDKRFITQTTIKNASLIITSGLHTDISFLVGDIADFNPATSALIVHLNGLKLIRGKDYELDTAGKTIHCLDDEGWNAEEEQLIFDFELLNGLVSEDGSNSIVDVVADCNKAVEECSNSITNLVADNKDITGRLDAIDDSITDIDEAIDKTNKDIESLKSSVSSGKTLVAAAITGKGVETAATDSFQTMSDNIAAIVTETDSGYTPTGTARPEHVLAGQTFDSIHGYNLSGTIPSMEGTVITPGIGDVTVLSGTYISGDLTISGDKDLSPEYIKDGATIFTVEGTFTRDATATQDTILSGSTAYAQGEKITGRIPNIQSHEIIPGPNGVIISKGQYIDEDITIKGDINLTPDKIAAGEEIYGVTGIYTNDGSINPSNVLAGEIGYAKGNRVVGVIESLQGAVHVPTTENIVLPRGKYLADDQVIEGSEYLVPQNIRVGVKMFGLTGTCAGELLKREVTIQQADAELKVSIVGVIQSVLVATSTGVSNWIIGQYFAEQGQTLVDNKGLNVFINSEHIRLTLNETRNELTYTNEYGLSAIGTLIIYYL